MSDDLQKQKEEAKKMRRTIKGMSEEFYDYGTLTRHDFNHLLKIQRQVDRLKKYHYDTMGKTVCEEDALKVLHKEGLVIRRIVEDKE